MDSDRGTSPEQWRAEDILEYLNTDKNNAKEILYSLLPSSDILTWNARGEIVYHGQDIRGTNIADLIEYTVSPYNSKIPEPTGLNIFAQGLAEVEIDKNDIGNKRVLTMIARKESDQNELIEESDKNICNSCQQSNFNMVYLGTCDTCLWRDFYQDRKGFHCTICDNRLRKSNFSHVIAFCPHCHCDEIMNVNTGESQLFEPKYMRGKDKANH